MPGNNETIFIPDNLTGGVPICLPVSVTPGEYKRGEVLSRKDNSYGKINVEGSTPAAVMPFDITIKEETQISVYVAGEFNQDALIIGRADINVVKTALSENGIFARKWGAAPDVA